MEHCQPHTLLSGSSKMVLLSGSMETHDFQREQPCTSTSPESRPFATLECQGWFRSRAVRGLARLTVQRQTRLHPLSISVLLEDLPSREEQEPNHLGLSRFPPKTNHPDMGHLKHSTESSAMPLAGLGVPGPGRHHLHPSSPPWAFSQVPWPLVYFSFPALASYR